MSSPQPDDAPRTQGAVDPHAADPSAMGVDPSAIDPEAFDAGAAAAQIGEGGRLMQSFVRQDQDPSIAHDLAVVSDFFGTLFLVPVAAAPIADERPLLATFEADGERVLGLSLREQEAVHLHRSVAEAEGRADDALGEPVLVEMLGAEVLEHAFSDSSFSAARVDAVVVDPLGLGIALRRDDALLEYPLRSGPLRRAVHQGSDAVLRYLLTPGARGVYMHRGDGRPLLLRRPSDGAQVFPVFSSALEVFRFSEDVATAEVDGPWLRDALPAGMHLVVDPRGDGVDFTPEVLDAAGFRTAGTGA